MELYINQANSLIGQINDNSGHDENYNDLQYDLNQFFENLPKEQSNENLKERSYLIRQNDEYTDQVLELLTQIVEKAKKAHE